MPKPFKPVATRHTQHYYVDGTVIMGHRAPPHIAAERDAFEKLFVRSAEVGEGDPYYVDVARCHLWTGHINASGQPFFWFKGYRMQAQRFAYELYNGRVPDWDFGAMRPCTDVAPRCTAANTKLCVSREHLQPVRRNSRFWRETTLEERLRIRTLFQDRVNQEDERLTVPEISGRMKLPEGRIYRILTRMEGDRDPWPNQLKLVKSDIKP